MSWSSDFWANTAVVIWLTVYIQPWALKMISETESVLFNHLGRKAILIFGVCFNL